MKKNLLFVLGLVAMLVMVAGCGDDEEDANVAADVCAKAYECKDSIDEALFAVFSTDEEACTTAWEAMITPAEEEATEEEATEEEATEEEATEEPAGTDYAACAAKADCAEFVTCMGLAAGDDDDDDTTDDDDDDDVVACTTEEDCEGWAVCGTDENDVAACLNECAAEYVVGTHGNESCTGGDEGGKYQFVTARYGDCAEVTCTEDADCAGLGVCDKTDPSDTKAFVCNTDKGWCYRQ